MDEVQRLILHVREDFRPYLTFRFFTGMRTGEIHGLKWKYIDFERREIMVRESLVAGEMTDTKTDSSARDIPMSQPVFDAINHYGGGFQAAVKVGIKMPGQTQVSYVFIVYLVQRAVTLLLVIVAV